MSKFLITAELRDLEKQVSLGEISYGKMVELLNEKANKYATDFSEWCSKEWQFVPPYESWRRHIHFGYEYKTTNELYKEFLKSK